MPSSHVIKFYLHLLVIVLSSFGTGWFACMVWYHIDPSNFFLYKAIYGTV